MKKATILMILFFVLMAVFSSQFFAGFMQLQSVSALSEPASMLLLGATLVLVSRCGKKNILGGFKPYP